MYFCNFYLELFFPEKVIINVSMYTKKFYIIIAKISITIQLNNVSHTLFVLTNPAMIFNFLQIVQFNIASEKD